MDSSPLRRWLGALGVRQKVLAERLGVSAKVVNNWCGDGVPAGQVNRICEVLNLPVERTVEFTRDMGCPFPVQVEQALRKSGRAVGKRGGVGPIVHKHVGAKHGS